MAPIHIRALDCLGRRIDGMPIIIEGYEVEDEPSDQFMSQTSAITDTVLCVPKTIDPTRRFQPKPFDAFEWTFFRITFCIDKYFDAGSVPWTKICANVRLPGRVQHLITLTFGADNFTYELQHTSTPLFHIFDEDDGVRRDWAGYLVKPPQADHNEAIPASEWTDGSDDISSPSVMSFAEHYDIETDSDGGAPLLGSPLLGLSAKKRKATLSGDELPSKKRRLESWAEKRKATFSDELLPPNKRLR